MDPKSVKTYFVRYRRNEFGYRCWNPETKHIVRAKNIVFVESDLYKHRASTSAIPKEIVVLDLTPEHEFADRTGTEMD